MGSGNTPSQNITVGVTLEVLRHRNEQLSHRPKLSQGRTGDLQQRNGGCEGEDGGLPVVSRTSRTDKHRSIEKLILKRELTENMLGSLQTTDIYSFHSHSPCTAHSNNLGCPFAFFFWCPARTAYCQEPASPDKMH